MFEYNMNPDIQSNMELVDSHSKIFKISKSHSTFVNYFSNNNIYNTSNVSDVSESFLALFQNKTNNERNYPRIIFENEIFNEDRYNNQKMNYLSWGFDNKIFKTKSDGFDIIEYNPYAKKENDKQNFRKLKSIDIKSLEGNIINGGSSHFGNLIECDNVLIVILDNNESKPMSISGQITRWRTYPSSKHYKNHLHVILDDRIEIYSFCKVYSA